MSEDSCNCGCSAKPEIEIRTPEDCGGGCGGTGEKEPKEDVVA